MKKTLIKTVQSAYTRPDCKTIAFSIEGVLCESGSRGVYGSPNYAGSDVEDDDYTTIF